MDNCVVIFNDQELAQEYLDTVKKALGYTLTKGGVSSFYEFTSVHTGNCSMSGETSIGNWDDICDVIDTVNDRYSTEPVLVIDGEVRRYE